MTTIQTTSEQPMLDMAQLEQAIEQGDVNAMRSLAVMYKDGEFGAPDLGKAKSLLENAIELGDAESMHILALMYKHGHFDGVRDIEIAKSLLEQAIKHGHVASMFSLALMYNSTLLGAPDTDTAKSLHEQAIKLGSSNSMFALGIMYQKGELGEPNMDKAQSLYEQALEVGHAASMYALALMYKNGDLGEPDMNKAKSLFERAIELGDTDSMYSLALMYKDGQLGECNVEKAKHLLEQATKLGHTKSMRRLALIYKTGELGEPDMEMAKSLYEKAIQLGDVDSMYHLAQMYRKGQLGEPDMGKAKILFEKAVELGDSDSMCSLALMYEDGQLGEPDIEKAISLYGQAVELDHSNSMFLLALIYMGRGLDKPDIPKAKTLLERASDLGDTDAMFLLGRIYSNGELCEPNIEKAKAFYERACKLKHAGAMYYLGLIYRSDKLGKPNAEKANALFKEATELGFAEASTFVRNPMIEELIKAPEILNLGQELTAEIESALATLEEVFFSERRKHLVSHSTKLAHFTTWTAIESILSYNHNETKRTCLRQYHVDYMNDPSEGQRLIKFNPKTDTDRYKEAIHTSKLLHQLFENHYFKSFEEHSSTNQLLPSVFTVSLTEESDRLDLWRAYGRDGHGICLVLSIEQNNTNDKITTIRNRSTSCEFLNEDSGQRSEFNVSDSIPPLYRIYYSDDEVAETLNLLSAPIRQIFDLQSRTPPLVWNRIASCSTAILLELLYLFKDDQYRTERETRALTALRLNSKKIKVDERSPGYLYCETPPFLFQSKNCEIVLGPKAPTPAAAMWNIRLRLSKLGLGDNVVVRKSTVPYR